MKKIKFYKILVFVLIALNLTTLFFLWRSGNNSHPHQHPRKSLVEILKLKGTAKDKIIALEQEHFRIKDSLMDRSRDLHEDLFLSFNDASKDSIAVANLFDRIVKNQHEIEEMTFYYFKKVNALCDPKQKQELQKLIHEVLGRVGGPPPPKR